MAITFVAAGTVASGLNPTVTVPAGYAAGDFLMIITASSVTTSTPGGWNLISAQGTGQFITSFYKIATASESSVTLTNSGATTRAVMIDYRGVSNVNVVGAYSNAASGFSITPPSQTTTVANAFVINIYSTTSITNGTTWSANPSTTVRVNAGSTSSLRGILIADELQVVAGPSTTRTATYTQPQTASVPNSGGTISLSPATLPSLIIGSGWTIGPGWVTS